MAKLWIFGDSFSMPQPLDSEFIPWTAQLAATLKVEESLNFAQPGVSNDYIFDQIVKNLNNSQNGDYVVIQQTHKSRQWFFEDPTIANYSLRDINKYISKDQDFALRQYVTHLQKDSIDELRFLQFGLSLERISAILQHVRILILPGFHEIPGVIGTLAQVCDEEFVDLSVINKFYESNDGKDPRINHLSGNNHKILADKIFEFFDQGKLVDLTTGFEKHFLK